MSTQITVYVRYLVTPLVINFTSLPPAQHWMDVIASACSTLSTEALRITDEGGEVFLFHGNDVIAATMKSS